MTMQCRAAVPLLSWAVAGDAAVCRGRFAGGAHPGKHADPEASGYRDPPKCLSARSNMAATPVDLLSNNIATSVSHLSDLIDLLPYFSSS